MTVQRYDRTETKILERNKLRPKGTEVFRSPIPLKVAPSDDDTIITAGDGDRLDRLSSQFYGTPTLWFVIASVNNINGTMHIKPGTQLRIPNPRRITG